MKNSLAVFSVLASLLASTAAYANCTASSYDTGYFNGVSDAIARHGIPVARQILDNRTPDQKKQDSETTNACIEKSPEDTKRMYNEGYNTGYLTQMKKR